MKRILVLVALVFSLSSSDSLSIDIHQTVRQNLVNFGAMLENQNLPVIGKLTNFLPCALLAASFKECPFQTMAVMIGVLVVVLARNGDLQERFSRRGGNKKKNVSAPIEIDESIFVFEGEDAQENSVENISLINNAFFAPADDNQAGTRTADQSACTLF